ncbi:hypothetical protein Kfla_6581 [Kribbella flavida DSM 17836]|uniref:DUF4440 domain-containing protein n=1 Tax=Kribbella flavida (strain DSM 17836 / JCM 10339 / NBRC 14399) TaxID=479435 RepID=D2PZL0_KRIFD|nr:nuclear transport factor 2 family protein [Kribbella flavida]ADB35576.1 hypothetical protein Kfla_6581 [Kribbella flavida DSM 17836]
MDADELRRIERARLRALVEKDVVAAELVHADDFRLVTPSGLVWSKEEYLGGIANGEIDYRRFEAVSEIEVLADGALAVLRYRSAIEIAVKGNDSAKLDAWHLDVYAVGDDGMWRVRWSQATAIS